MQLNTELREDDLLYLILNIDYLKIDRIISITTLKQKILLQNYRWKIIQPLTENVFIVVHSLLLISGTLWHEFDYAMKQ